MYFCWMLYLSNDWKSILKAIKERQFDLGQNFLADSFRSIWVRAVNIYTAKSINNNIRINNNYAS